MHSFTVIIMVNVTCSVTVKCILDSSCLGLEPHGNCIDRPANFKIETFAGGKGEPLVLVKNPRGQPERVSVCGVSSTALLCIKADMCVARRLALCSIVVVIILTKTYNKLSCTDFYLESL